MTQTRHSDVSEALPQHQNEDPHTVEVETQSAAPSDLDPVVGLPVLPPSGIGEQNYVDDPIDEEINNLSDIVSEILFSEITW